MTNMVELMGALISDPALTDLKSGALRADFTVAVKGVRWDRENGCDIIESAFIACIAWEDVAEVVAPLAKGTTVWVKGQLTQQEVTDSAGRKDRKTKVRALVVDVVRTPSGAGY